MSQKWTPSPKTTFQNALVNFKDIDDAELYQTIDDWCKIMVTQLHGTEEPLFFTNEVMKFVICFVVFTLAIILYSDKRLSMHPGQLIIWIAICQGSIVQLQFQEILWCELKIYKLMSWTFIFPVHRNSYSMALYHFISFLT